MSEDSEDDGGWASEEMENVNKDIERNGKKYYKVIISLIIII